MEVLYHDEVKKFIKKLQKPTRSKILHSIELIESYGLKVGMPHVKKITNFLYEIRVRGFQEVRIIFAIIENKAVLIRGFVKKTNKIPQNEIETAENRRKSLTIL